MEAAQYAPTVVDVDLARLDALYARYLTSEEFKRLEERRTAWSEAVIRQKSIGVAPGVDAC